MSTTRARAVSAGQWGIPDRDEHGRVVCRWCRGPVQPPRRTFCGEACVHEWKIRSSPWYVRREVKKRDRGICRLCGVNVVKAHREWTRAKPPAADRAARKRWRQARPRWEADHIVPVADGGGECGLDNYRLLCRRCHVQVTSAWRSRRPIDNPIVNPPVGNPPIRNPQSAIANEVSSPHGFIDPTPGPDRGGPHSGRAAGAAGHAVSRFI